MRSMPQVLGPSTIVTPTSDATNFLPLFGGASRSIVIVH